MLEIPSTQLQGDAIREAAKLRGVSVGDYVLDCAMTYATTHLSRGLADWVEIEERYVAEGNSPACGASLKLPSPDGQPERHLGPCIRVRNHQSDAVAGRESHAFRNADGDLNTWQ